MLQGNVKTLGYTAPMVLGSTQKFRRVDWTINLSLIAKFLVLGSIGDHWS